MQAKYGRAYDGVKRALDFSAATVGLIFLSPILVVVAAMVAVRLGRPVLFKQDRPGKNGRLFRLIKFRTMHEIDCLSTLVTDEQRLTRFGRVLRSTSLDELPTLLNVLKGEMSMVGPRPLLERYLNLYSPQQSRRHEVRPGITGLAQVNGRNSLSWSEKLALDTQYVDDRSFLTDARILARTLGTVILRRGVTSEGHATASEFVGDSANVVTIP